MAYRNIWTICAAASAAAVVVGAATPTALAQQQDTTIVGARSSSDEERSGRVAYDDLNLAAIRGEQTLQRRVKWVAQSVCAPNDDHMLYRSFSRCVSGARNGALPQIDLAVRRAREIARNGTSSIPLVAIAVVGTR